MRSHIKIVIASLAVFNNPEDGNIYFNEASACAVQNTKTGSLRAALRQIPWRISPGLGLFSSSALNQRAIPLPKKKCYSSIQYTELVELRANIFGNDFFRINYDQPSHP